MLVSVSTLALHVFTISLVSLLIVRYVKKHRIAHIKYDILRPVANYYVFLKPVDICNEPFVICNILHKPVFTQIIVKKSITEEKLDFLILSGSFASEVDVSRKHLWVCVYVWEWCVVIWHSTLGDLLTRYSMSPVLCVFALLTCFQYQL